MGRRKNFQSQVQYQLVQESTSNTVENEKKRPRPSSPPIIATFDALVKEEQRELPFSNLSHIPELDELSTENVAKWVDAVKLVQDEAVFIDFGHFISDELTRMLPVFLRYIQFLSPNGSYVHFDPSEWRQWPLEVLKDALLEHCAIREIFSSSVCADTVDSMISSFIFPAEYDGTSLHCLHEYTHNICLLKAKFAADLAAQTPEVWKETIRRLIQQICTTPEDQRLLHPLQYVAFSLWCRVDHIPTIEAYLHDVQQCVIRVYEKHIENLTIGFYSEVHVPRLPAYAQPIACVVSRDLEHSPMPPNEGSHRSVTHAATSSSASGRSPAEQRGTSTRGSGGMMRGIRPGHAFCNACGSIHIAHKPCILLSHPDHNRDYATVAWVDSHAGRAWAQAGFNRVQHYRRIDGTPFTCQTYLDMKADIKANSMRSGSGSGSGSGRGTQPQPRYDGHEDSGMSGYPTAASPSSYHHYPPPSILPYSMDYGTGIEYGAGSNNNNDYGAVTGGGYGHSWQSEQTEPHWDGNPPSYESYNEHKQPEPQMLEEGEEAEGGGNGEGEGEGPAERCFSPIIYSDDEREAPRQEPHRQVEKLPSIQPGKSVLKSNLSPSLGSGRVGQKRRLSWRDEMTVEPLNTFHILN